MQLRVQKLTLLLVLIFCNDLVIFSSLSTDGQGDQEFPAIDTEAPSSLTCRSEVNGWEPFKDNPDAPVGDASVMFHHKHFQLLENAIDSLTTRENSDGGVKHGSKHRLLYLIKTAAGILKATYRSEMEDKKAQEIDFFIETFDLNKNLIFGDAEYAISRNQQEKLRAPEEEPDEDDIIKLRSFITTAIQRTSDEFALQQKN